MEYDAVVIGAGLAGLVAAAKIAKEGKNVLVLEQCNAPGGCAATFKRGEYIVEGGLHMMFGNPEESRQAKILKEFDVFDHVEFVKCPEFYRFMNGRVDVTIPFGVNNALESLVKQFPNDEQGLRSFFHEMAALREQIFNFPKKLWQRILMLPLVPFLFLRLFANLNKTLGEKLDKYIENEDLKLALLANISYYHDDPRSMSFLWFASAQIGYLKNGGEYVKGGSRELAWQFARQVARHGGEVRYKSLVTEIIAHDGRAIGVRYRDGSDKKERMYEVFAKRIVANAAIPNVVKLLPQDLSPKLADVVGSLEYAQSLFTIYLGLSKQPKEFGCENYSVFIYDENVQNLDDVFRNNIGDIEKRSFCFVDFSQIDSGLAPEGHAFCEIVCADYLSEWERLDPQEYEERKKRVLAAFMERLENVYPGITEHIEFSEVATPKTIERWTLNPGGTPYGYAQVPSQAGSHRLSVKSPIENLYFASAWTNPGGGFTPCIFCGYMAAKEVLHSF